MKKGSNLELKINIQCHWHEGGSVQNEDDTVLDFGIKGIKDEVGIALYQT